IMNARAQASQQAAIGTGGGVRGVTPIYQGVLNLPTVEITFILTNTSSPTASATPVVFDKYGTVGTRSLTNVTVSGTFGANTESVLANISVGNPPLVGRVTLDVDAAATFTTLNWFVLQGGIDNSQRQQPINVNALKSPTNFNDAELILRNLNLKL